MKKNLLIGAITNYAWEYVAPFFKSYQRAGFENCDCVMFVANMSESTIEKIKSCGVTVLPIPQCFNNCCVNIFRWDLYFDFLRDKEDIYDIILTTDVRDVFFQRDVFKLYQSNKNFLGIAIEDGTLEEPFSRTWITRRYGEDKYETIKNERIICDGTVWGTCDIFVKFTELMVAHLESVKYSHVHISDQASTNFFIYHDKMFADSLIKSDNQSGYVMTIGRCTKRENIKLDSNNNILNGNGEIAAVVHQYDRHPDITEKIIDKFCPEIKNSYFYYKAILLNKPGFIWRVIRYYYRVRKIGLFKALYITIRKRLPGGKNFG